MAFVWNTDPNIPVITPSPVLGPNEVSTQVHVVANTVNVSPILCTLSYNTHNIGYDVICALPSLNVHDLHVSHLNADNVTVHFNAAINTATIGVATINTANIVNATIANGVMGVNPTSNSQIATREYVDAVMANSTPLGGNLQLLIQAAGDLLVGVSDNTAERLPVGTIDRQVLAVGGSGNTGVHWVGPQGSTSSHRGLLIGTNWDDALKNTQIYLISTDEIVMDDGERVSSGWNGLTASITSNVATSGIGYLDTGVVLPNTCYEVYAVRNSGTGDQGLLLHRAKDINPDTHLPCVVNFLKSLNQNQGTSSANNTLVAQKFFAHKNGPFVGIDLSLTRVGTPIGNVWVTLEGNDANNNASGVILATSRKVSTARIGALASDPIRVRFPFDASANVVAGNAYWAVVRGDYSHGSLENLNYLRVAGDSTLPYAIGTAKFFNANTNGWALANSALAADVPAGPTNLYFRTFIEANDSPVLMPTGYDQKCLLSYCSTNIRTTLREYHQREYKMVMAFHYTWCYHHNGGLFASKADSPGANNSTVVAFSEPIHMGEFVPPVPCLVWVYRYSGLGVAASLPMGDLSVTELPAQPLVSEVRGSLYATISGSQQLFIGPLFVEYNALVQHSGGATFGNSYIAEIEF